MSHSASDREWSEVCRSIERNDEFTRGIVILGKGSSRDELIRSFEAAAKFNLVKGFAIGRTIFQEAAEDWFDGSITDEEAIDAMRSKYADLCDAWDNCRRECAESEK